MNALPPIVRLAAGLTRDIETAVMRFPRYHKYVLGADLRRQAMAVWQTAMKAAAWDRTRQAQWVRKLVDDVDNLKLTLQLAKEVHAFSSFAQFEHFARVAADLGRQVGGWHRQLNPQSQNAPSSGSAQRAKTLSTRDASMHEANS